MSKLVTLNGIDDSVVLDNLLNNEIFIYEDIQGSKIWINWNGSEFNIRTRNLSSDNLSLIDLTVQNYYNPAITYLNSLDSRVRSLLNRNWWFCFEYFPDNQPANIEYSKVPKNGLVLTSIFKSNKYSFILDELDEYARLFDVDVIPVLFNGKLTDKMKEAIIYFLNTNEDDLDYIFGEQSFAFFFYKILNPSSKNSFLMDDDFHKNIEKLVIRCDSEDISFQLLNPLYKRISDDNNTEFVEIYTLILVSFLNFCQSIDFDSIKIKGDTKEHAYIYLMCKLYNIYVGELKDDLLNFDFIVPEFFNKEKFKINKDLIDNKLTLDYIKDSKLEYIFKVLLGSFNKKRKKPIGIFNENTVILFNRHIDLINICIEKYLNRSSEMELKKAGLLDFGEFFSIEYDKDAAGDVYPDVYTEFEKGGIYSKKKKKIGFDEKK